MFDECCRYQPVGALCQSVVEFMLESLNEALLEAIHNEPAIDQVTDPVTDPVIKLLRAFGSRDAFKVTELMAALGLAHKASFRVGYLRPALTAGLIEMTHPDTPNSPAQRYRLTEAGRRALARRR